MWCQQTNFGPACLASVRLPCRIFLAHEQRAPFFSRTTAASAMATEAPRAVPEAGSVPPPLLVSVWRGSLADTRRALSTSTSPEEVNSVGPSGETALALALRSGHVEIAQLLLEAGAVMRIRDRDTWPLTYAAVALARRDPLFASRVLLLAGEQAADEARRRGPYLHRALAAVPDFTATMEFNFSTWMPLLGRVLPSDTCTIRKVRAGLRLDCTLAGFSASSLSWKRGDLSFVLTEPPPGAMGRLVILDHVGKRFAEVPLDEEAERKGKGKGKGKEEGDAAGKTGESDGEDEEEDEDEDGAEAARAEWGLVVASGALPSTLGGLQRKELRHAFIAMRRLARSPWPNMDTWSRDVVFTPEPVPSGGGLFSSLLGRSPAPSSSSSSPPPGPPKSLTETVGAFTGTVYKASGLKVRVEVRQPMEGKAPAALKKAPPAAARGGGSGKRFEQSREDDGPAITTAELLGLADVDEAVEGEEGAEETGTAAAAAAAAAPGLAGRVAGSAAGRTLVAAFAQLALGGGDGVPADGDAGGGDDALLVDPMATAEVVVDEADFVVACGKAEGVSVPVAGGCAVEWSVVCDRHDIGFTATFEGDKGEGEGEGEGEASTSVVVKLVARTAEERGAWTCPAGARGTLSIALDNTYALWHDKHVSILIERVAADGRRAVRATTTAAAAAAAAASAPSSRPSAAGPEPEDPGALLRASLPPSRRVRSLETHPLALQIPVQCGLVAVPFAEYFRGATPALVREAHGLAASELPDDSRCVLIAPPPSSVVEKSVGARVVLAPAFPLAVDHLLPVAEVLSRTGKHFANVHRFLSTRFPSEAGFPVAFDVPVVPSIGLTAQVRFTAASLDVAGQGSSDHIVEIPADYTDATEDLLADKFFEKTAAGRGGNEK
jgi:hypothetical protein